MDFSSQLEREIAMRMSEDRPDGWPSDERGDFFWESQVLVDMMGAYAEPEAQEYLNTRLEELKAQGSQAPIAAPTAEVKTPFGTGGLNG